jgi:hypothetical protein
MKYNEKDRCFLFSDNIIGEVLTMQKEIALEQGLKKGGLLYYVKNIKAAVQNLEDYINNEII